MVDMHVRFDESVVKQLKLIADDQHTSVAEVVRYCVNDSLGITRLEKQTSDTIEEMSERITERRHRVSTHVKGQLADLRSP